MAETDEVKGPHRVRDRRRFDADGNPRPDAEAPSGPGETLLGQAAGSAAIDAGVHQHLQSELELTRRRFDELARAYQALERDREDFKARLNRERERMIEVEKGNVALALLEAVDELDLCLSAVDPAGHALAQGVKLIRDGILSKLAGLGVERLSVLGVPFDPNLAEAADLETTIDPEGDGRVAGELRAGYRLNGRVIRPARVKVAKFVKPAQA